MEESYPVEITDPVTGTTHQTVLATTSSPRPQRVSLAEQRFIPIEEPCFDFVLL